MDQQERTHTIERIKGLCDQLRELAETEENERRQTLWEKPAGLPNVFIRHLPRPNTDTVPFIADLDREMWAPVLSIPIERIYAEPLVYLEFELKKKIYAFQHFQDDNPLTHFITIWRGCGLIESLLGLPQAPAADGHEPWPGRNPILNDKEDLASLSLPDFRTSGAAPEVHRMYTEMREVLPDDFTVIFPEWDFGPFGISLHLRGMSRLPLDMLEDPEFIQWLMQFILEAKMHWSRERASFLGEPIQPLYMPSDDVSVPMISPQTYRDLVLPIEKKMSDFHGGMDYWHSCGKIDPLIPLIKEIPNLRMIHVSPFTDIKQAVQAIGRDHIIEIVLNPIDDVENASQAQMEDKLHQVRHLCDGLHYTVRADAFQVFSSVENDLAQIKLWIDCCRRLLS